MLDTALASVDLSKLVLAVGGLGTAAYGLVDATKALGGGVSRAGFGDIKMVISQLIPPASAGRRASAITRESAYDTLRANWMNGMALPDQKSVVALSAPNTQITNWRQALAAGFVSSRF